MVARRDGRMCSVVPSNRLARSRGAVVAPRVGGALLRRRAHHRGPLRPPATAARRGAARSGDPLRSARSRAGAGGLAFARSRDGGAATAGMGRTRCNGRCGGSLPHAPRAAGDDGARARPPAFPSAARRSTTRAGTAGRAAPLTRSGAPCRPRRSGSGCRMPHRPSCPARTSAVCGRARWRSPPPASTR